MKFFLGKKCYNGAMKKRNLVVANWKMNPQTLFEAKKIVAVVKKALPSLKNTDVVVCPPAVFLSDLGKGKAVKNLYFGAQDISLEQKGAHTGEISGGMMKDVGAMYTIIGHSEKRKQGETNHDVRKKIEAAFDQKLTPIICIGEVERDQEGEYLEFIKKQIKECLFGLRKSDLVGLIVAYEPIWAIGKSYKESMHPTDIHEMVLYIKKYFGEIYGHDYSKNLRVLYGGSVEVENASDVIKIGNVDGFLVGHDSLSPERFTQILKAGDIIAK